MVAAREFTGPLALLAPSFSREDESKFPRALDRLLNEKPDRIAELVLDTVLSAAPT
jgi:hypothetical protein